MSKTRMGDEEQPLQGAGDSVSPDSAPTNPPEDAAGVQPDPVQVQFIDPFVGCSLGDYYIMRRIGEGGMGIVYLARHQSLDRLAAVKFLAAHMVTDKAYIERFLKEARGAAKLNHPNIVAVYDAGSYGENVFYFIMEYVEGRDLGTMLRERRIFPVPEAVAYMRQAASALGYAHKKRIIHRDIKPDNFLLTNEGIIKVGDLGLAKWMSDDETGGMTQSGVVMGTPFYISPEQVRGSRDVDWRSDVYSLGSTFFHLVTGRIPYEGSSPAVIMAMHLNNPPPDPSQTNNSLDLEITSIIKKMMAKNPDERFQTMEEVDAALSDYQAGRMRSVRFNPGVLAGLPASQALPPTEPPRPPDAPPERLFANPTVVPVSEPLVSTKTALILGASLVLAAVVFGAFFFLGKAFDYRKGKEAQTAAQPVVKAGKPAALDAPVAAVAAPAAPEKGFVRTAPIREVTIPTEVSPQPADANVVANFNNVSDANLNRDFGMWTSRGAHGNAQVESNLGPDQSGAFRIRYDVTSQGSEWGVWGRIPAVPAKDYQALAFRMRSEQDHPVKVSFRLKWELRDGEQGSDAILYDLGKEWKTVMLPLRAMNVPPEAVLQGFNIYFRSGIAEPPNGEVIIDDVALLKHLPAEKPGQGVRVEFMGATPPAPTQVASLAPSNQYTKQTAPREDYERALQEPHYPDSYEMQGQIPVLMMTPDGVMREPPPEMVSELTSPGAEKRSYFSQNFEGAKAGQLPAGVACVLFDASKRASPILVPASGYSDTKSRCQAKWEVIADPKTPGGHYIRLTHQTGQPQWIFATLVDATAKLRSKKFCLTFLVRGTEPGTRLVVTTQPEAFRTQPMNIGDRWTMVMVPMPPVMRLDLQKIVVGVLGTGEIHLAAVRADPMPDMIRKKMEKERDQMRGGTGPTTGYPTGGGPNRKK